VDGGVFVNNPSMAAYAEARNLYPDAADFVVVSVGTGDRQDRIKYAQAKDWGLVGWAKQIVPVFMDSVSESVDYEMSLMPGCSYHRLQVENLQAQEADMDDVTAANLTNLQSTAKQYFADQAEELDAICSELNEGRGSDMPGIGR
jgi:patatin-like phospholipase/acyl hydrolase